VRRQLSRNHVVSNCYSFDARLDVNRNAHAKPPEFLSYWVRSQRPLKAGGSMAATKTSHAITDLAYARQRLEEFMAGGEKIKML
jgi:hypothetical protein